MIFILTRGYRWLQYKDEKPFNVKKHIRNTWIPMYMFTLYPLLLNILSYIILFKQLNHNNYISMFTFKIDGDIYEFEETMTILEMKKDIIQRKQLTCPYYRSYICVRNTYYENNYLVSLMLNQENII